MHKTEFDIIVIFEVLQVAKNKLGSFFFDNRFESIGKVYLDKILYTICSQLFILRDEFSILKGNSCRL